MRFSTKTFFALSLSVATLAASLPVSGVQAQTENLIITEVSSEEAATLDQVDAYVEAWQLEDAIALLEGVAAEGSELPQVYQKLGDLYLQAGYDPQEAANSYIAAMQLAEATADLEAQAQAQVSLATLASEHGQSETAQELLEKAQANYEEIGATEQAEAVAEQMSALALQPQTASPSVTLRGGSQRVNIEFNNNWIGDPDSPSFCSIPNNSSHPKCRQGN